MSKYICKNCGINEVVIDNKLCDECQKSIDRTFKAIAFGITHGRGRIDICDHENKGMWDYHTRTFTDEYGNEGTIDQFTCASCGEVMEEERTS